MSPERIAGVQSFPVTTAELVGTWEQLGSGRPASLVLDPTGTIGGDPARRWQYSAPWLTLGGPDGGSDVVRVQRGCDWKNRVASTLLYSGLDRAGSSIWGRKRPP